MSLDNTNCNVGNIADYTRSSEDMDSIFEEIELILQNNQCLEISPTVKPSEPNTNNKQSNNPKNVDEAVLQPAGLSSMADPDDVTLDFLPRCSNHEFLISTDTHAMPEEELSLYSVNQNELHPVNAPFMVPGIYKKIANASVAASDLSHAAAKETSNVFFATRCAKGKIISRTDFENCSAATIAQEPQSNNLEKSCAVETPSDSAMGLSSNTLLKFACSIYKSAKRDQFVIDTKKNEVARTSAVNNKKIIYRLQGPEELNLLPNSTRSITTFPSHNLNCPLKLKIGRPKKQAIEDTDKQVTAKKAKLEQNGKVHEPTKHATDLQQPSLRTRSGRVVKLVKPHLSTAAIVDTPVLESEHIKSLITDSKDKTFHANIANNSLPDTKDDSFSPPRTSSPIPKRRVPPESICPKCGKIFLGRRLQRHFTQHPDHMLAKKTEDLSDSAQKPKQQSDFENTTEDMTLFRFLISKLQKPLLNEDQRADLFLNELNDLVEQLQLRSTRLIRNTSGLHYVSARTARVLGIPEGQYALDMSAIVSEIPLLDTEQHSLSGDELKRHQIIPPMVTVNPPCLDYANISLDNTLTDEAAQKLNLSAGGKLLPPSEESLLRAVDVLVHDGITKLVDANILHPPRTVLQSSGTSTLVPHYDHVSDNAVEALTIKDNKGTPVLGLSVDFFQFKNN